MSEIHVCDLCGKPLSCDEYYTSRYKIKQLHSSWWEASWVKIEAHDECVQELMDNAYARKVAEERCKFCGGKLSEEKEHNGKRYRHCYGCHFDWEVDDA